MKLKKYLKKKKFKRFGEKLINLLSVNHRSRSRDEQPAARHTFSRGPSKILYSDF